MEVPPGDERERAVCPSCEVVHYVNPKIVCGCLLTCGEDILLARRAIQPRHGYWTIPAGFMELGETMRDAACRECYEEALAAPAGATLYGMISLPRISQVYAMYRGEVEPGAFGVGEESSEVQLFAADALPWDELAFPIVELTLRRYLRDRASGRFPIFDLRIDLRPGQPLPREVVFGES